MILKQLRQCNGIYGCVHSRACPWWSPGRRPPVDSRARLGRELWRPCHGSSPTRSCDNLWRASAHPRVSASPSCDPAGQNYTEMTIIRQFICGMWLWIREYKISPAKVMAIVCVCCEYLAGNSDYCPPVLHQACVHIWSVPLRDWTVLLLCRPKSNQTASCQISWQRLQTTSRAQLLREGCCSRLMSYFR